ncbi:MAG: hypothetical protein IJL87_01310 [Clostridia bacterium]|nr:hypothetical protein [Clostridia bacterium]
MLSQLLSLWQSKNSLDVEDGFVYGVFNDIGFSVNDETGGKLIVVSAVANANESYKRMQELCRMMGGCFSFIKVGKVENYLALFADESNYKLTVNDLDSIIQFVASNYSSAGFSAHTVCYKCGQPSSKLVFKDQLVRPICKSCSHDVDASAARAAEAARREEAARKAREEENNVQFDFGDDFTLGENNPNNPADDYDRYADSMSLYSSKGSGSMLGGFLGAIIGSLIGVLPYLLFFAVTKSGISFAALCIIAPFFAILVYGMFKGKRSLSTCLGVVIIVSSIVSMFSVLYTQAATGLKTLGKSGGMSYVLGNLSKGLAAVGTKEVLVQLLIAVIAVVLGSLLFRGTIVKICNKD